MNFLIGLDLLDGYLAALVDIDAAPGRLRGVLAALQVVPGSRSVVAVCCRHAVDATKRL